MTRFQLSAGLIAITLGASTAAHAQSLRTWVSGVGDDANPCSRTAPCKSFAGALSKTSAGGEIDALDAGDFGPVSINKAITINGGGGQVASALATGGAGILIQAGANDAVLLRNIDVIGSGLTGDGVQVSTAGSVHLQNLKISGFQGNGINISSSTTIRVFVDEVTSSENGLSGLNASGNGVVANVSINNSHFEHNAGAGVMAAGGSKVVAVNVTSDGNASGFAADKSASDTLKSADPR